METKNEMTKKSNTRTFLGWVAFALIGWFMSIPVLVFVSVVSFFLFAFLCEFIPDSDELKGSILLFNSVMWIVYFISTKQLSVSTLGSFVSSLFR